VLLVGVCGDSGRLPADGGDPDLPGQVRAAMRRAAGFYRTEVAAHGGYVYYYSVDLTRRWGEGEATVDQVWVQPPGTPTVGLAYLKAHAATGDAFYLEAARAAAEALVYGQLASGGWTHCVDFDPQGDRVARYRNGRGRGKNNSSLDDGQTQSAIRLLARVDAALEFKHKTIHTAASVALDALLAAQFPNGAFPQVWTGPVGTQPVLRAAYPDYDWRREGRVKNYWDMYTLNDNVAGHVARALIDAHEVYGDPRYESALRRLGDFLILAQMPDPQPAWAQQYNYRMRPIWARKFEPPAIAARESQEVLDTLMQVYRATGDPKYLEPIPSALKYLKRSVLSDGRLARYYELRTNKPLYLTRRGREYRLTYDDSDLPKHYEWKAESRLVELERAYQELRGHTPPRRVSPDPADPADRVRQVLAELDDRGRWISVYQGERLTGQPPFEPGTRYLASEVFSQNLELLSTYLLAAEGKPRSADTHPAQVPDRKTGTGHDPSEADGAATLAAPAGGRNTK
jgi:PelA/Pel-15E family pectate lyase